MLSRFISRSSHIRLLTLISSNTPLPPPRAPLFSNPFFSNPNSIFPIGKSPCFSTNRNDNGDNSSKDPRISNSWNFSSQNDDSVESLFGEEIGDFGGVANGNRSFEEGSKGVAEDAWSLKEDGDAIGEIDKEFELEKGSGGRVDEWETAKDYKPWSFGDEEKSEVFYIGDVATDVILNVRDEQAERKLAEENAQLDKEKQELSVQLKGPNRAFGDLIAASGITDEMIDSLILLQDVAGIEGLPPLSEIEDIRLQKNEKKITRAELERKKQEEIAKSRVRQVDEKGRAYGTGRRKCSVARVWVEPGDGKFVINDKPFDTYFPILDHRAELLRPFSETKTLGLWDVKCTVKGGGVSGQVGAVRLGISRALQNWEPGLRPNLRAAGFLTRDSRVVERKKPGKAKARKSFQWVKR